MTKIDLETPKKDIDFYRDTPVRYLGYANEVGESFRSIIGTKWVLASYGVATLYALADTADKSFKAFQATKHTDNCKAKTLHAASDTLIWQLLASVIIPGFTINRVCASSNYILGKYEPLPKNPRQWIVTAIGLSAIPFIIKPIDRLVDIILDMSFRKFSPK